MPKRLLLNFEEFGLMQKIRELNTGILGGGKNGETEFFEDHGVEEDERQRGLWKASAGPSGGDGRILRPVAGGAGI
jgi:hypothetical protein